MQKFLKFIFGIKFYMFRTVSLSIIRSFLLYAAIHTGLLTACEQAVCKPVWHIPLLCVQWKAADDVQRNCPKHVEFYFKNEFEKLVHLFGFVIRIHACRLILLMALTRVCISSTLTVFLWVFQSSPPPHNFSHQFPILTQILLLSVTSYNTIEHYINWLHQ